MRGTLPSDLPALNSQNFLDGIGLRPTLNGDDVSACPIILLTEGPGPWRGHGGRTERRKLEPGPELELEFGPEHGLVYLYQGGLLRSLLIDLVR